MTKIRISGMCIETYPCIHKVHIDGVVREMNGVQIERLLRKLGQTSSKRYKHFEEYKPKGVK